LNVLRIVVENILSYEIVISWVFWIEFKAYNVKALALDQTSTWKCSECQCGILHYFVINRSVTCIVNLNCLVYWFVWTTRRES